MLATFYKDVVNMAELVREKDHVVLEADGLQLVIHGIPKKIANSIVITTPPKVREDSAIKVCFPVDSIDEARGKAMEHGGQIAAKKKEWEARGFRACDGHDQRAMSFRSGNQLSK